MGSVNGIVRVHQKGDIVLHLFFIGVVKFLEGAHVLHPAGLESNLLPLVPSVGKHQFQGTAHVEKRRVMPPFRLPCLLGLHTADDIVLPGVFQGESPAQEGRNNHLVVIVGRQPDSRPCQIRRLDQQLMRGLVPHPNGQRRLGQEHMLGGGDTHKGKVVGDIAPVPVLASHYQVLEQAVPCKALRTGGVPAFVQVIELHPQAVQKLLGLLSGKPPLLQVLFIVRVHVLVKPSRGDGMPAGLQLQQLLHKPEALAGLIKGRGPPGRDAPAVGGNLRKLLPPDGIRAGSRLLLRQIRIPGSIADHRLAAENHRLQELGPGTVVLIPGITFFKLLLNLGDNALVAHGQNFLVLHRHMAYAVVKVVAGSKYIVVDGLPGLLRHKGGGQLAGGSALPVGVGLPQLRLGPVGYVERIRAAGGNGLKFRLQPFVGKLRVGLAAPGRNGTAAHHQLSFPDNNGDVVQNMRKGKGAPHDNGLVLGGLVGFRQQSRPGGLYLRHPGIQMRHQPGDPLCSGYLLGIILCHDCTSFPDL